MKYVVGCLAFVGLVVVLMIGGCFGLIGFGVFSMAHKPPYAEKPAIEKAYRNDLDSLKNAIASGAINLNNTKLSASVLAVYLDDREILGKFKVDSVSYEITNGSGTGSLTCGGKSANALVYELVIADKTYKVFLLDSHRDG